MLTLKLLNVLKDKNIVVISLIPLIECKSFLTVHIKIFKRPQYIFKLLRHLIAKISHCSLKKPIIVVAKFVFELLVRFYLSSINIQD